MSHNATQRKAFQEPMVWLMVGIPALTVIAGIATLIIALRSGELDSVPSPVVRVAQTQTLRSPADATASRLGYRGLLRIDRHQNPWQLQIQIAPESAASGKLQVLFVHPQFAKQDVLIELEKDFGALSKPLPFIPQQVVVTDSSGIWRLIGAYSAESDIVLTPSNPAQ